jgi:hypothetical protein
MKIYNLSIILLFFTGWAQQQFDKAQTKNRQILQLTIALDKDTFLLDDKIIVNAQLLNKTNEIVIIPANYTLTSNLYPNGVSNDKPLSGGTFNFQISPVSKWTGIYIEDLVVQEENKFISIKPNSVANFEIGIGEHVNSFNKNIDRSTDSLKIKGGFDYNLQMTYSNKATEAKNIFNGQVQSNKIKVFLK